MIDWPIATTILGVLGTIAIAVIKFVPTVGGKPGEGQMCKDHAERVRVHSDQIGVIREAIARTDEHRQHVGQQLGVLFAQLKQVGEKLDDIAVVVKGMECNRRE